MALQALILSRPSGGSRGPVTSNWLRLAMRGLHARALLRTVTTHLSSCSQWHLHCWPPERAWVLLGHSMPRDPAASRRGLGHHGLEASSRPNS